MARRVPPRLPWYGSIAGSVPPAGSTRPRRYHRGMPDGGARPPGAVARRRVATARIGSRGDEPVPAPARPQPGGLVSVGPGGAGRGARAGPADLPLDRLRGVPLVSRHGARVVRGRGDRAPTLRRDFVAIKVDREERPDLDQVYMAAVQALTGSGGWPMSVFLTPDGRPFYGGTYFPPEPRHGMPAFRQVLAGVADAWRDQRSEVESSGQRLVDALAKHGGDAGRGQRGRAPGRLASGPGATGSRRSTRRSPRSRRRSMPAAAAGAGRRSSRRRWRSSSSFGVRSAPDGRPGDDARALAMARRTLDAMAAGGIHDQLGGGFHRYSTDANWLVPHFEQMLYDNAQLARVYLHAWQLTGERSYRDVAIGTLDFMARDLTPAGRHVRGEPRRRHGRGRGRDVHLDAPARSARRGWGRAAGDARGHGLVGAAYGVTDGGNWEGRTILSRVRSEPRSPNDSVWRPRMWPRDSRPPAPRFGPPRRRPQPAPRRQGARRLERARDRGIRRCGRRVHRGRPRRNRTSRRAALEYRAIAVRAADALLAGLGAPDGRLRRSWKDGRATRRWRPRGPRASRRGPARALRGDVRRALVRGRA